MIKTLRLFLVAIMAMMVGNVMAEDIIWQEDFASYSAEDVPTGGSFTYACVGSGTKVYDAALAGGTTPELLVAKNNGSFSATISLSGKSGSFSLQYKANYDRIVVTATGATIGDKAVTGNSYIIPVTVESGTTSITLTFTNTTSSNVRLDDIKLYQGEAKKPAGLSWGKASTIVTLGGNYDLIPTLKNENNLTVTCSSNNESVCTVTNEGVITVVGAGEATITATFLGNDEYEAQTVSITITVNKEGGNGGNEDQEIQQVTVAQALDIINALEDGTTTTETYRVEGYVISFDEDFNPSYGNYTMNIADGLSVQATLKVFRAKNADNQKFESDVIKAGDKVLVEGKLQKYLSNSVVTPELSSAKVITINNQSTSGIDNIKTDAAKNVIFNLAGQRVKNAQKGLYIVNGKKYMVK